MIEEIAMHAMKAKQVLNQILDVPESALCRETVIRLLSRAVSLKLMIPETEETSIRKLVIQSIKRQDGRMGGLAEEILQKQITRYDCHQTSLVAKKKVLLLMFIEKETGITMGDEEAAGVETLGDLAEAVIRHRKEGGLDGCT